MEKSMVRERRIRAGWGAGGSAERGNHWEAQGINIQPGETEGKSIEGVCNKPGLKVECILPRFKARRTQSLVFNLLPGRLGNDRQPGSCLPGASLPHGRAAWMWLLHVTEALMREQGQVIPGRNDGVCDQVGRRTKKSLEHQLERRNGSTIRMHSKNRSN